VPLNPLRGLYRSIAQVLRISPQLDDGGSMSVSWAPLTAIIDPYIAIPGQMACRIDLGFIRRGYDMPMPLTAGRAPDRLGLAFFDLATDQNGIPLVLAGDRLQLLSGPIWGTFDIRSIPDVAQSYTGAHHVEVQVIEVSQALQSGSPIQFPGGQP
jgi:hypothetical protein